MAPAVGARRLGQNQVTFCLFSSPAGQDHPSSLKTRTAAAFRERNSSVGRKLAANSALVCDLPQQRQPRGASHRTHTGCIDFQSLCGETKRFVPQQSSPIRSNGALVLDVYANTLTSSQQTYTDGLKGGDLCIFLYLETSCNTSCTVPFVSGVRLLEKKHRFLMICLQVTTIYNTDKCMYKEKYIVRLKQCDTDSKEKHVMNP